MDIVVCPRSKRRFDLDNLLKAVLDSMQDAGLYEDDEQVDELKIVRGKPCKGGACIVEIEEIDTSNLTKSNLPVLVEKLKGLIESGGNWQVLIKERSNSRSVEQNARLWELYSSIGDFLGYTASDMHDLMGYKFLLTEKIIRRAKITKVISTTKLTVPQMADYQLKIEALASSYGWSW